MWQEWIFTRTGESIIDALKCLPEEYVVLNDLMLPEGKIDFDYVVAGPNGLFTVETKDWTGEVKCKGHDWFIDRRRVRSPGRTAQLKASALRKILVNMTYDGEEKIPAVSAILAFTHPDARVGVSEPAVPAMRVDELASFILHYKIVEITDTDRAAIVQHLISFPSRAKPRRRGFLGLRLGKAQKTFAPRSLA